MHNCVPGYEAADLRGHELIHRDCDAGDGAVVVDLRDGRRRRIPAAGGDQLQVAGRYAAWTETADSRVVVYDMQADQVAYSVPPTAAGVEQMDLDDDGTVVVVGADSRLWWAAPDAPEVHPIPVAKRQAYGVAVVARRIAFLRGAAWNWRVSRGEIGVADFDGRTHVLGRGASGYAPGEPFGFDGERVVWSAYACKGAHVHVQRVDADPTSESMGRCPPHFARIDVHKRRRVEIEPDCYGYVGGCRLRDVKMTRRVSGRRVLVLSTHRSPFRLTVAGDRLLRERGPLRVRVAATLVDYAGTRERRHGSVVLPLP